MNIYIGIVKGGQFWGQIISEVKPMSFSSESDAVAHWPKKKLELNQYEDKTILIQKGNNSAASVLEVLGKEVSTSLSYLYENRTTEESPLIPM